MLSPLILVLAVLAVYRLTTLVTQDKITAPLRRWYVFTCPWCVSVWMGGGVTAALAYGDPRWVWLAILPFALSGASLVVGGLIGSLAVLQARAMPPAVDPSAQHHLMMLELNLRRTMGHIEALVDKNRGKLRTLTEEEIQGVARKAQQDLAAAYGAPTNGGAQRVSRSVPTGPAPSQV